ncbi:MAG: prenyltransferase [Chloroflexi bacterium]|nr:MAG: prenyltransferase [Chloroflexota bacterium]
MITSIKWRNSLIAYTLLARPMVLIGIVLVYTVGSLIARALGTAYDFTAFGVGLAALLLVSIGVDYANEYADVETDALTHRTLWSGGSGVLPQGSVPQHRVLFIARLLIGLGLLTGLLATLSEILNAASLLLLIIGAVGGWVYSMPPLALAWHGWGELTNAVLGGLVLPLYGYTVQTATLTADVTLACLPFVCFIFLNMLATTWPDRHADAQVGKRTLATRWSAKHLRLLYIFAAILSYAILAALNSTLPREVLIASVPAIPLIVWAARGYTRGASPIATVIAMSTLLTLQMAAWFIVG